MCPHLLLSPTNSKCHRSIWPTMTQQTWTQFAKLSPPLFESDKVIKDVGETTMLTTFQGFPTWRPNRPDLLATSSLPADVPPPGSQPPIAAHSSSQPATTLQVHEPFVPTRKHYSGKLGSCSPPPVFTTVGSTASQLVVEAGKKSSWRN